MTRRPLFVQLLTIIILGLTSKYAHSLRPSHFNDGGLPPPPSSTSSNNYYDNTAYTSSPERSTSSSTAPSSGTSLPINIDMMEKESVEERLASWRAQQQYKYEHQSPLDAANPRDDDGRMKLLASVSKGSISLFFFILMWRSVHHFELADQSFKGSLRVCMVFPTVVLFLGNMVACVASVMSSSNASRGAKKRMKAVLNLNKLMELSLICYNVMRLLLFESKNVPREIYVGRTLTNFLFVIQCQLFTKVTWGAAQINSSNAFGNDGSYMQQQGTQSGGYYGNEYQNQSYSDAEELQQHDNAQQMNHRVHYSQQRDYDDYGSSNREGQW